MRSEVGRKGEATVFLAVAVASVIALLRSRGSTVLAMVAARVSPTVVVPTATAAVSTGSREPAQRQKEAASGSLGNTLFSPLFLPAQGQHSIQISQLYDPLPFVPSILLILVHQNSLH